MAAPTGGRADGRGREWLVLAAAGGSALLYAALLQVVPDLSSAEPSYVGQLFAWVPLLERDRLGQDHDGAWPRFLVLLLALYALYALTIWRVAGAYSAWLQRYILLAGALLLALHIFAPVLLARDLYAYVAYGRSLAIYHGDPYSDRLGLPPTDPYLVLLGNWGNPPSYYGPLWTLLSAGLAVVAGERLGLAVLLFRLLTITAALAAASLLSSLLRQIAPQRAAPGLVYFLWNPLLVLETGLSAHNDVLMATLVLLGLWLHLRRRSALATAALALSVLVKWLSGVLVPLYALLVLRQQSDWAARTRYCAFAATASLCAVALMLALARTGPQVLAVGALGSSTIRYTNSLHELLFRELRAVFGEERASTETPVWFQGWWMTTTERAPMRAWSDPGALALDQLAAETLVFVIAPWKSDWLRVYEPQSGQKGYVHADSLALAPRPTWADGDSALEAIEAVPQAGQPVVLANGVLRIGGWALFGLFWLLAAMRVRDLDSFLRWSTVGLLASYWLVSTWFWPWYVIWALALAATAPTSRPALLGAILSASVLTLYASIGYQGSGDLDWVNTYRSLPAFVLPLALFLAVEAGRRLVLLRRQRCRNEESAGAVAHR